MYFLINAIKNIGRNKGRNILIGSIILTLITVSIISLCINNTTGSIIDDYKTRFGSEVNIAPDLSKGLYKQLPTQQCLDFAESEYLKESIITGSVYVSGNDFKAIDEDKSSDLLGGGAVVGGGSLSDGVVVGEGSSDFAMPTMNLIGNQWDEFKDGYRTLIEGGAMPEKSGECIISKELSELNGIKVGDMITVKSSYMEVGEDNQQKTLNSTIELKVTGIYFDATKAYSSDYDLPLMNRRNEVLTTMDTLTENENIGDVLQVTAKYYLKNPSMLKDFEAEIRTKGLDEYFLVSTDEAGYQKVVGPVEGLKKISITFMIIVLAFGAVIIILLSSIAIRERKYEIGVLRAMGMKKRKVIFGLLSEMLMITALCLIVGIGIGSSLAQPVSDTLLAGQIENAKATTQQNNNGMQGGLIIMSGDTQKSDLVPLEQVNVSVGADTIIQIAIIALLLASLASMAAIAKVTKYEPIKILMERN